MTPDSGSSSKQKGTNITHVQLLVGPMDVFAYLLACPETKICMLVDPGGEPRRILDEIKQRNWKLEAIINTHGHSDHIAANAAIHGATGCRVIAHTETAASLAGVKGGGMLSFLGGGPPPPVDTKVKDGDKIDIGNQQVEVIHTPGHTRGDICLFWPGFVVTGDTLFVGGFGRTDLPGGSTRDLRDSIKNRLLTLPPETVVLPGHDYGPTRTSTIAEQAKELGFFIR